MYAPLGYLLGSTMQFHGELVSVCSGIAVPPEDGTSENTTREMPVPVTTHAVPWMVCVIIEPPFGFENVTLGAACAAKGAAASSAQAASANGFIRDFIETLPFLGNELRSPA